MNKGIIFLGASKPWVFSLAIEVSKLRPVVAIELLASEYFRKNRFYWPSQKPDSLISCHLWSYPPGFNGRFASFFNSGIRARLNKEVDKLKKLNGQEPYVLTPYPWLVEYLKDTPKQDRIYFNLDDYFVNSSRYKGRAWQEDCLIKNAKTILCASLYQTQKFKEKYPSKAKNIMHFPFGVMPSFLNPHPENLDKNKSVFFIGYFSSRLDWELINEVVISLKEVKFIFVGDIGEPEDKHRESNWWPLFNNIQRRPNVELRPKVEYSKAQEYYWRSSINWIPYRVDSEFNQASCPAKIMDCLASGRRLISSDISECRLYPEWISIYHNADEAVSLIKRSLADIGSPEEIKRSRLQIEFAHSNIWAFRAAQLLDFLDKSSA